MKLWELITSTPLDVDATIRWIVLALSIYLTIRSDRWIQIAGTVLLITTLGALVTWPLLFVIPLFVAYWVHFVDAEDMVKFRHDVITVLAMLASAVLPDVAQKLQLPWEEQWGIWVGINGAAIFLILLLGGRDVWFSIPLKAMTPGTEEDPPPEDEEDEED